MRLWANRDTVLFSLSVLLLVAGIAAALLDASAVAVGLWVTGTLVGLAYSTVTIAVAVRRRQPSVDVIAWLALVGALLVGEPFAGAVIAVMLSTGGLLEARASARARRELSLLAARAPRIARRKSAQGLEEIPVDQVAVGDRLLVGSGEIVPVDGRLVTPAFSTSRRCPVKRSRSTAGPATTSAAAWSTPAQPSDWSPPRRPPSPRTPGVVRLVEQAQAEQRPVRPARRPVRDRVRAADPRAGRRRPGRSPATRSGRWRCSWSRRRARCCSPRRSPSCPGCPGRRGPV